MTALSSLRDTLLAALAVIGTIAVLTLMLHVFLDVVLRNTANQPIPATYEIVTNYYMIAMAFIPLAWVEKNGGMIQVEVIEPLLGPRALRASDILVALLSTVIYGALSWFTLESALKNFVSGTFVMAQNVPLPTWPAYFLVPLGFAIAGAITALRIFDPGPDPR